MRSLAADVSDFISAYFMAELAGVNYFGKIKQLSLLAVRVGAKVFVCKAPK